MTPAPGFWRNLVRVRPERFDLHLGLRGAVLVLAPLIVGYLLGLVEACVLVTLGALNLLFVEAPGPEFTRARTLAVACVTNTVGFAAGTLAARAPLPVELPLVGAAVAFALLGARWPEWQNVSFIGAVMVVIAVGIPVTNLAGEGLRPFAILLGGLFALSGITIYRAASGSPRPPPYDPAPADRPPPWRRVVLHAGVVGTTVAVGLLVGGLLGLPRDYWIMLTVIVALRFDLATTVAYSAARIFGTVGGAAVAFVVTDATGNPWLLFPLLAAAATLCLATRAVNYTVYAVWVTLTVIVLLNLSYAGGPRLAVTRVVDTVIGGGLALLAALVLWITVERHGRPDTAGLV
ncbi:MAG TPA: FUSC family protein [Thermoplasmata archaeon]|nr:FUSC family protein [Thermoplasmata archaeon]